MEGFEDPFNRQTYPWGREDRELVDWFRALGALRRDHPALRRGDLHYVAGQGPVLAFLRTAEEESVLCAFNAGEEPEAFLAELPGETQQLLGRAHVERDEEGLTITVPPQSGVALKICPETPCHPEDAIAD